MAMVHHLYIGHFIPEQGYVRFLDHTPIVTRPLDMKTVVDLLRNYLGEAAVSARIPDHWAMSILPDYIVCDQLGSPAEALLFAADYAEKEGAAILDIGAFALLTPGQVRQAAALLCRAQPA